MSREEVLKLNGKFCMKAFMAHSMAFLGVPWCLCQWQANCLCWCGMRMFHPSSLPVGFCSMILLQPKVKVSTLQSPICSLVPLWPRGLMMVTTKFQRHQECVSYWQSWNSELRWKEFEVVRVVLSCSNKLPQMGEVYKQQIFISHSPVSEVQGSSSWLVKTASWFTDSHLSIPVFKWWKRLRVATGLPL